MKQKIILLLSSLIISVILSETILGLMDIPKFYKAHSFPPQFRFSLLKNGNLFYTNSPSAQIAFKYDGNPRGYFDKNNTIVHTTNSMGFRGREFTESKRLNTIRIAFLGDSFTFGEGVKDQDIFTQKIEDILNKNKTIKQYECLNFGVGGYNTRQSLLLLKNIVHKLSPDIVVLCYTLNDIEPDLFYYDKQLKSLRRQHREAYILEGSANERPPSNMIYKLRISKLIWQIFNRKKISKLTIQYYQNLFNNQQLWYMNKKRLKEIITFCKNNNIKCYVTIIPLLYQLNSKYPFINLHEKVENAVSSDVHVIKLLQDFIGKKDTDLWVHQTDQHPNEIAHKIIANRISEVIITTFQQSAPADHASHGSRTSTFTPRRT